MEMTARREDLEFDVYYQPQIQLSDGGLFGAEALARKRTGRGLADAETFVPRMEAAGEISRLDLLMLARVIKQQRLWRQQGFRIKVSVNLSRASFDVPLFARTYLSTLWKSCLPPESLGFELTETTLGNSPAGILSMLYELSELGYAVFLDDFGTGYSSLSMLDRFPSQFVKLDKLFLDSQKENRRGWDFLGGLLRFLHDMGIKAVCEGVENEEQARNLKRLGCELAQGYYFAQALPTEEFEKRFLTPSSCLPA